VEEIGRLFTPPEDDRPEGFIDRSGLVTTMPDWYIFIGLQRYEDEDAARRDLQAGSIAAYYVIPEDYIESGRLLVFTQDYSLSSSGSRSTQISMLINYNLLGQDEELAWMVFDPLPYERLKHVNLSPPTRPVRDRSSEMTFFLPYGVMMLFYITIMGSSGLLLNSVTKEKENRMMEILMVSVTPHEMLLGKIAGIGVVGLLQVSLWGLSAFTLLRLSGQNFNLPEVFQLDPSILGWGLLFYLLGYLLYASLMAGIGALVPSLREASQATTLVIMPLLIPMFLLAALISAPNGALATGFSLFPLTAPTMMMLRIAASDEVPLWQILLSAALLFATVLLVIRAVAGMFRAQTLLSGQGFSIRRYLKAMVGR
jgi:ABC-2 type transport system permease protein